MRHLLYALLLVFSTSTLATAAEEPVEKKQVRSYINNMSCGKAIESLDTKEGQQAFALLVGAFVTGTNHAKHRDSQVELQQLLLVTEKYCRQYPDKPVLAGLVTLDVLIDQQLATAAAKKE